VTGKAENMEDIWDGTFYRKSIFTCLGKIVVY